METTLTFQSPRSVRRHPAAANSPRRPLCQPLGDRSSLPVGAGDPAFDVGGAEPFIPVGAAHRQDSPGHWVDALVTMIAMAWFALALVGIAGEWRGPASTVAMAQPHTPIVAPTMAGNPVPSTDAGS